MYMHMYASAHMLNLQPHTDNGHDYQQRFKFPATYQPFINRIPGNKYGNG